MDKSLAVRLPTPRLQLRWATNPSADSLHEYLCHYELVIPLREHDIRREVYDEDGMQTGETAEMVIRIHGPTKRDANHRPCCDMLGRRFYDEPYRDGMHAKWDSEALGGIPIFVIDLDGNAIPKPPKAS